MEYATLNYDSKQKGLHEFGIGVVKCHCAEDDTSQEDDGAAGAVLISIPPQPTHNYQNYK